MRENITPTPGPWRADYLDQHGQRVVKGEHIEIATCWHHSVGAIEREMEANAKLISAAPDFVAGIEQMLAYEQAGGEGWWKGWEMLKAAYAKAGLL